MAPMVRSRKRIVQGRLRTYWGARLSSDCEGHETHTSTCCNGRPEVLSFSGLTSISVEFTRASSSRSTTRVSRKMLDNALRAQMQRRAHRRYLAHRAVAEVFAIDLDRRKHKGNGGRSHQVVHAQH